MDWRWKGVMHVLFYLESSVGSDVYFYVLYNHWWASILELFSLLSAWPFLITQLLSLYSTQDTIHLHPTLDLMILVKLEKKKERELWRLGAAELLLPLQTEIQQLQHVTLWVQFLFYFLVSFLSCPWVVFTFCPGVFSAVLIDGSRLKKHSVSIK